VPPDPAPVRLDREQASLKGMPVSPCSATCGRLAGRQDGDAAQAGRQPGLPAGTYLSYPAWRASGIGPAVAVCRGGTGSQRRSRATGTSGCPMILLATRRTCLVLLIIPAVMPDAMLGRRPGDLRRMRIPATATRLAYHRGGTATPGRRSAHDAGQCYSYRRRASAYPDGMRRGGGNPAQAQPPLSACAGSTDVVPVLTA